MPNSQSGRLGEGAVGLRQRTDAFLDGAPVVVEGLEDTLACLPHHADIVIAGRTEQSFEAKRGGRKPYGSLGLSIPKFTTRQPESKLTVLKLPTTRARRSVTFAPALPRFSMSTTNVCS